MVSRKSRSPLVIAGLLIMLIALIVGMWLGGHPGWMPSSLRSVFVAESNTRIVDDVLNMIERDYYRPVNRNQLVNQGLAAMVASLNDPYSHYYDPSSYGGFLNETNPHLSGIGVDVVPAPQGLHVVGVFPDSPAAKAGVTRGDFIVAVGGVSLAHHDAAFGSRLIKGPAGTRVTLTISHGRQRQTVAIVRQDIVVPVATGDLVSYRGIRIGDLQFTSFTDGSADELRAQVKKLLHGGARALILDLRENGGGLLNEAVKAASIFIPDGTIVSSRGRNLPEQVYTAQGNAIPSSIPMVVLVDRGTASSAEIVTAALQDRRRALVVGTHTYGKGVFQEIEPLPNGGALDITVGEYFTPNDRNLGGGGVKQGAGVTPNVQAVDNPRTAVDDALVAAERTVAAEVH